MAALAAYALLVLLSPLLHHDQECHWRTPGHCVACVATPVALGADAAAQDASPALTEAGDVEHAATPAHDARFPADTHGRSPPFPGR